ncbi:MAG: PEP-CTERM sorting domain-containing protein [Burkholderiales bacterium]|jgi:hypothetical protein|nr:PEP-CTERM sorting domain-containing protein [Burkholderiales bacterium]MBW8890886.1 PEP-CTERM sorting domain-containing protein [Burkholderiales bacterium]
MLKLKARGASAIASLLIAGTAGATTTNGFANGGFEIAGGSGADGWATANSPAKLSSDAHTGAHSALLSVPGGFGASTLFQDSVAHGHLAPLGADNVGDTPVLSFWSKGDVATTGNVNFWLRYMGAGGILLDSGPQSFGSLLNTGTWTQISFQGSAIPAGTTSVMLEINTAVGPLIDSRVNAVYIDDVQLALHTAAVPEPETYALLLAGLTVVGTIARRRA